MRGPFGLRAPVGRVGLRKRLLVCVAIVAAGVGTLTYATDALRSLELSTVDARFSIRGPQPRPDNLAVVGIDAVTFQALLPRKWPYSHDIHAQVVDNLRRDGAKVIAFDIQFSEPRGTERQAVSLLDSIERAGNVVLASTEVDGRGNGNVFAYAVPRRVERSRRFGAMTRYLERDLGATVGYSSFETDPGGVIRRFDDRVGGLDTFALASAERAAGKRLSLPGESAWIDYYGPPRRIKTVRYSDVYLDRFPPGTFKGKTVVIGATHQILQDRHPTSTSGDAEMAGPEIHANAIGTALRGFPLRGSDRTLELALIALMGLVAPAATMRLSGLRGVALAIAAAAAYAGIAQLAFNSGRILPFVYPLLAAALAIVGTLVVHGLIEAFERQRTRDIFGRFVPESVVGQALSQAGGVRLGGVAREATVMFSDLRGFTSFAESLEPDQVITILNRYLTAMVDDAIMPHGGTLVDYMGDGIMAVFGAPIEIDDHADRALAAARDKLRELDKFNRWLTDELGFDKAFRMGIGLNTGRVMSGNVGSERRLAYTAIGDTTNTAARLEGMTKGTPYMLYLSETTKDALTREPDDVVYVDSFEVRGREQEVSVWSVEQSRGSETAAASFQSVARAEAAEAERSDPSGEQIAPDGGP